MLPRRNRNRVLVLRGGLRHQLRPAALAPRLEQGLPRPIGPALPPDLLQQRLLDAEQRRLDDIAEQYQLGAGNCYITRADGKKPEGEHIPFEDIKGGYALRIAKRNI